MIKTKVTIEHKILCTCGGEITTRPLKIFERRDNPFLPMDEDFSSPCFSTNIGNYRMSYPKFPTCTRCGKEYEIKIDSNNMTITMTEK